MQIQQLNFPLTVKWYITGRCNLRCTHCYLTDYTKEPPLSLVQETLAFLANKGVRNMALLGGEPFYRKDILDIIQTMTDLGITNKVATNGTMLTYDFCTALKDRGLRYVQVSLEGHSPELSDPIRGAGTFDSIMDGLKHLKQANIWGSVAFTLSAMNVRNLREMFAKVADSGTGQIKLAAFVPIGTGSAKAKELMLTDDDLKYLHSELPVVAAEFPDVLVESSFLAKRRACGSDADKTLGCGAGTSSLIINNDMTLSACDILTEEDRTTEQVTKPEQIEELWRTDPIFQKWRGKCHGTTPTIKDFDRVHLEGCHVAYATYGKNILEAS